MIYIDSLIDKYSKDALEMIVSLSNSMAELVINLGYKSRHGKNYETVQKRLDQYEISTSHFNEAVKRRVVTEEDVFCIDSTVSQSTLRRFYLNRKDTEYKCAECGIGSVWNSNPLSLQLDHKDGDNTNNLPENLRWLCPNCHSQTKTFAGKNNKNKKKKTTKEHYCIDCGKKILSSSLRCKECHSKIQSIHQIPFKDELESLLKSHNGNFTSVANVYNVSPATIRRWCDKHNISTHSKDYKIHKPRKIKKECVAYEVEQIDILTGNVIATFNSIREAERITGIYHIFDASNPNNSRKSAGGFYWRRKQAVKLNNLVS